MFKSLVSSLVPKLLSRWQTEREEITLGEVTHLLHRDFCGLMCCMRHSVASGPLLTVTVTLLPTASPLAWRGKKGASVRNRHTVLPQHCPKPTNSRAKHSRQKTGTKTSPHMQSLQSTTEELSSHLKPHRNHLGLPVSKASSPKLLLQGIADLKMTGTCVSSYLMWCLSHGWYTLTVAKLYFWMWLCVPASFSLKSPLQWWWWLNLRN